MKTKKGIYLDLKESDFIFEYDKLKLVFSSKFYLEKFNEKYVEFTKQETNKLRIKYDCIIVCDEMILLKLYRLIEKRGFLAYYDNKKISRNYGFEFTIGI